MSQGERPRRYGDEEVARILERATEIRSGSRALARGGEEEGFTLEELEEIAAEAGIDVVHLRQAAAELDAGREPGSWGERFTGAPHTLVREAVVEGSLGEDGFQVLLALVQSAFNEHGHPSLMGRTLTWRNETQKAGGRSTMVTVSSRSGRTTLRLEENLHQVAGGFLGGITLGGGLGVGLGVGLPLAATAGSVLLGLAFPLGALGAGYAVARASYRAYVGRRNRVLSRVMARLEEAVRDEVATPGRELRPPD